MCIILCRGGGGSQRAQLSGEGRGGRRVRRKTLCGAPHLPPLPF